MVASVYIVKRKLPKPFLQAGAAWTGVMREDSFPPPIAKTGRRNITETAKQIKVPVLPVATNFWNGMEPSQWKELSLGLAGPLMGNSSQKLANHQLSGEQELKASRLLGGSSWRRALSVNTERYQKS